MMIHDMQAGYLRGPECVHIFPLTSLVMVTAYRNKAMNALGVERFAISIMGGGQGYFDFIKFSKQGLMLGQEKYIKIFAVSKVTYLNKPNFILINSIPIL